APGRAGRSATANPALSSARARASRGEGGLRSDDFRAHAWRTIFPVDAARERASRVSARAAATRRAQDLREPRHWVLGPAGASGRATGSEHPDSAPALTKRHGSRITPSYVSR